MYQNILLAYDGSPEGREALVQVRNLASVSGATVHLLAIIDPSESMLVVEGMALFPTIGGSQPNRRWTPA